jgi:TolB-like protein
MRLDTRARQVWFWSSLLLFLLGGCSWPGTSGSGSKAAFISPEANGAVSVATPDFFGLGEDLATQLKANLRKRVTRQPRLIMATFVNIDDLGETSRFGRTLSEAMANRLFRHGFGVEEIRKTSEILMKNQDGELVLSRDASRVTASVAAEGIVSGTYALTPDTVIVSVRLLDAASQEVLSVADMEIQRSPAINDLLRSSFQGSRAASSQPARGSRAVSLSAYER